MRYVLGIVFVMLLNGCTEAERGKVASFGRDGHVKCYSGGQVIFEANSSGKINSERDTDGWYFVEKETGELYRVSGDCIIRN